MKKEVRNILTKLWGRKFYNRLFLINAIVFIIVVYLFAIFASMLVTRLEMSNRLQHSREVLMSVCDEYNRKHDNFPNILMPLYSKDNSITLMTILKYGIDLNQQQDPFFKKHVANMMQYMTLLDSDIAAILLRKNSNDTNFVYNEKNQSFEAASPRFPFFAQLKTNKLTKRSIYGVNLWKSENQTYLTYGIAGNLSNGSSDLRAGTIMVAYDVMGLHRIFQQNTDTDSGHYYILTKSGEVIFDSKMEIYGKKFPHMELVNYDDRVVSVDGVKSVVQSVNESNRGYYGLFIEPNNVVDTQILKNKLIIFAISTGISLLSAFLYLIAGFISTRRVNELEHAMENVGSNNLSYRILFRGAEDEFKHIAAKFNVMCDDLQDNINKLYINEIKQKNAELKALEAGLNPHFLYNTLDAVRSKAHEDGNEDVAEFIVRLSSLLRTLVRSKRFIPIRQEIDFCKMYLSMFMLRYEEHFTYEIDVQPEILEYGVPKGILQPLLENYFVHGLQEGNADNYLQITGVLQENQIIFQIKNNGKSIDIDRLNELKRRFASLDISQESYGLANVHERIVLVFGKGFGLTLESNEGSMTIITVTISALTCEQLEQSMRIMEKEKTDNLV